MTGMEVLWPKHMFAASDEQLVPPLVHSNVVSSEHTIVLRARSDLSALPITASKLSASVMVVVAVVVVVVVVGAQGTPGGGKHPLHLQCHPGTFLVTGGVVYETWTAVTRWYPREVLVLLMEHSPHFAFNTEDFLQNFVGHSTWYVVMCLLRMLLVSQ